jgi:hypothetical protein
MPYADPAQIKRNGYNNYYEWMVKGYPSRGYPPGSEHRRGRLGNPGHQELGAPSGKNYGGDNGKFWAVIQVSVT